MTTIDDDPQLNDQFLTKQLPILLSPKFGILKYAQLEFHPRRSTAFHHSIACANNTDAFTQQTNFKYGKGVSISKSKSLKKAVGESLERYASAVYDKDKLHFSSQQSANFNALNTGKLFSYTKEFYNRNPDFQKIDNQSKVYWQETINLQTLEPTFLPASLIYLPYKTAVNEIKFIQNISTGLACHTTYQEALMTAICEVLERDAFMIFWRNEMSPKKIDLTTLPHHLKKIIHTFTNRNLDVTLLDMSTEIQLPIIFGVLQARHGYPVLAVSASCKLSAEAAIQSTLEELELVRHNISHLYRNNSAECKNKIEQTDVKTQKQHILFWQKKERLEYIQFITHASHIISFEQLASRHGESAQETLHFVKTQLRKHKMTCYVADITTKDLRSVGFHVIRAVIPEAHPLAFGHGKELFDCERLYTMPEKLGVKLQQFSLRHCVRIRAGDRRSIVMHSRVL